MKVIPIKTDVFYKNEDLIEFLIKQTQDKVTKESVLVVTSKLLSLWLGLTLHRKNTSKDELIKQNCDHYLGKGLYNHHLTISNSLIMPTAGIDKSNSKDNELIILPTDLKKVTQEIHSKLSVHWGFNNWGLIVSDSKTSFLRLGVTGVSLSYFGFQGLLNLKGKKDIFGKPLAITTQNRVDALAAAAVFEMGESNEQQPLALITDVKLNFSTTKDNENQIYLNIDQDLYSPLYSDKIQY